MLGEGGLRRRVRSRRAVGCTAPPLLAAVAALGACGGATGPPGPRPAVGPSSATGSFARTCGTAGAAGLAPGFRHRGQRFGPLTLMLPRTVLPPPVAASGGRFGAYEVIAVVDAGQTVTMRVPATERGRVGLLYDLDKFRDDGSYRIGDLDAAVTLRACRSPRFNHGVSQFDGGFVASAPGCVRFLVSTPGWPPMWGAFGVGRRCGRPGAPDGLPRAGVRGSVGPMDREALAAVQGPLKERYRREPAAAEVVLHAEGALGDGISCSVSTGRALAEAGLHPATGGDGSQLCSGDMLLQALVACAGVTLRAVATAIGVDVRGGTVRAEGTLDFRGTLSVVRDAPVGFKDIRLRFDLDSDADDEQLATLLSLTERFCVVLQTLRAAPSITATAGRTS